VQSWRYHATLSIEQDGAVSSVRFDDSAMDNSFFGVQTALRKWRFSEFAQGTVFPIEHRVALEFVFEEVRPRYPYGRPWVEFDLNHIRIASHPGLPHIN
jgi:hypothetical protein